MNAVTEVMDELRKALSEVDDIRASLRRKVRHCDELFEERDQMERERDEAQWHAEGLRAALVLVESERDQYLRERGQARLAEERAEAFRRGAEAMREACQQWCRAWENDGEAIADALADLSVPEEP